MYSGNRLRRMSGVHWYRKYTEPIEAVDKTFGHNIVYQCMAPKTGSILYEQENIRARWDIGGETHYYFKYEGDENAKQRTNQNWTLILLEKVRAYTAVAIKRIYIEDLVNNYQNEMSDLFQTLAENKSKYYPNTTFSKHGITADCKYSGLTAEVFHEGFDDEEPGYISCVSKAKLKASEDSKRFLEEKFKDELEEQIYFRQFV